jgi:hypothetical protein
VGESESSDGPGFHARLADHLTDERTPLVTKHRKHQGTKTGWSIVVCPDEPADVTLTLSGQAPDPATATFDALAAQQAYEDALNAHRGLREAVVEETANG